MVRRHRVTLWLLCAALFQLGCGGANVQWKSPGDAHFRTMMSEPVHSKGGLSGEVQVYADSSEGVRKGRIYFAIRTPDKLLLEAVTPSDDTIATVVMNGTRFMSFQRGQSVCVTGAPCMSNVSRILPVALDGAGVIQLLYGRPPLLVGPVKEVVQDQDRGRWIMKVDGKDGTHQVVEFLPDGSAVSRSTIRSGKTTLLDVRYSHYKRGPHGALLPRRIHVNNPGQKVKVSLRVLDVTALEEREATFSTECPAGTTRQEEPCL